MNVKKKTFTLYKDPENDLWYQDNKEGRTQVEFAVVRPDRKVEQDALIIYNKELRRLVSAGTMLRCEVDKLVKERGVWTDEQEKEYKRLQKEISDCCAKLLAGRMKKAEGYALAVKIIKLRNELNQVMSERNSLYNESAESQADNAKFNYYIASCTVRADGTKYFDSYEDMLDSEDNLASHAGLHLMELLYNATEIRKSLPEYKFLLLYNFCDEELRLQDAQGNYVDLDGKHLDKDGFYVNESGERVDEHGNKITRDVKIEDAEFYE